MPTATDPYVPALPGHLITAEAWNEMQKKIQEDIEAKVKKGVYEKTTIQNAENAGKLENKTPEQLAKDIVDKALAELTKVTGYRNYFKLLELDEETTIKHDLRAFPLVDIYELEHFPVICSEDEEKSLISVTYFLFQSGEKVLRLPGSPPGTPGVEIQPTKEPYFRIPFSEMLHRYDVEFDENSTLDDLETEFWEAFFKAPNDEFHDDQYGHSPWFDRCCGDRRTVGALKRAGNWDELWFKMIARKTINFTDFDASPPNAAPAPMNAAPAPIQVVHYDFDTIGLTLLAEPVLSREWNLGGGFIDDNRIQSPPHGQLKVMVLLNAGAGIKIVKPACD